VIAFHQVAKRYGLRAPVLSDVDLELLGALPGVVQAGLGLVAGEGPRRRCGVDG
jgi:hypothetical protein